MPAARERNIEYINAEFGAENAVDNGALNPPTRVLEQMYKNYVRLKLGGTTWPGMIKVHKLLTSIKTHFYFWFLAIMNFKSSYFEFAMSKY